MNSSFWEQKKMAALAVPITTIASHEGFERAKRSKRTYYSPFRKEKSPSFVVYPESNRWVDYGLVGSHRGGDGINLVQMLHKFDFKEAVEYLLAMDGKDILPPPSESTRGGMAVHASGRQRVDEVVEIRSRSLVSFLASRRIPAEVARQFCKEVHYTYSQSGRNYFGIGFANDLGGWVIRTAPYTGEPKGKKMDILASGITTIRLEEGRVNPEAYVFEGFLNFLSWVVLFGQPDRDVIVLNSVENKEALSDVRSLGTEILHCFLDNDEAGDGALTFLRRESGCDVIDHSELYRDEGLNDLNDYLCGKRV